MTADLLNRIPVTPWVTGTVARVLRTGRTDAQTWNDCWYDAYTALGGQSQDSGNKGCPRAAARGLWLLGRLRDGQRPLVSWSTAEVYRELGKNAAYATLAAELQATRPGQAPAVLWPLIQHEFTRCTGVPPARSEQGEVRLVVALVRSQQLILCPPQ